MKNNQKTSGAWTLWLPVSLAFLLVIAAWAYTIQLAGENPASPVPLKSDRPAAPTLP
jgi:hypothetical protein